METCLYVRTLNSRKNTFRVYYVDDDGCYRRKDQHGLTGLDIVNVQYYPYFDETVTYSNNAVIMRRKLKNAVRSVYDILPDKSFFPLLFKTCGGMKFNDLGPFINEHSETFTKKNVLCDPNYEHFPDILLSIRRPVFIRKPENKKTSTFDYILVECVLHSSATIDDARANANEIVRLAYKKIAESRRIKNHDFPISFLKLYDAAYNDKEKLLKLGFELKEV